MQIIFSEPPNFEAIKKAFNPPPTVIYSYGDTVFNPGKIELTADLIEHEQTHLEQQRNSREAAAIWWEAYLRDPAFRISQEAEAYGVQYRFLCRSVKDRNKRSLILDILAGQLSSPLYGSAISRINARKLIADISEGRDLEGIEDLID